MVKNLVVRKGSGTKISATKNIFCGRTQQPASLQKDFFFLVIRSSCVNGWKEDFRPTETWVFPFHSLLQLDQLLHRECFITWLRAVKNNSPLNSPNLDCPISFKCSHTRQKNTPNFLDSPAFLSRTTFFLVVILADREWKGVSVQLHSVLSVENAGSSLLSYDKSAHPLSQGSICSRTGCRTFTLKSKAIEGVVISDHH